MINCLRNSAVGYGIRERLGPELAAGWDTAAWWSVTGSGWTVVDGESVDCDGTDNVSISKASFWLTTKTYRIAITVDVTAGGVTGPVTF